MSQFRLDTFALFGILLFVDGILIEYDWLGPSIAGHLYGDKSSCGTQMDFECQSTSCDWAADVGSDATSR